jgi:guanylate kinase
MVNFYSNKFLIILMSPSGGGKSSIAQRILADSANIAYSISYTTRPARINETDGIDYNFISEQKFHELLEQGEFLEHAFVHGYNYGTSRKFIQNILNNDQHAILDIDVQGALQIMDKSVDLVTIFILPPSQKVLEERLRKRKTDSQEVIDLRLKNAREEIDYLDLKRFDYLVINDDFETAVQDVKDIISCEEKKLHRIKNIKKTFYGG